ARAGEEGERRAAVALDVTPVLAEEPCELVVIQVVAREGRPGAEQRGRRPLAGRVVPGRRWRRLRERERLVDEGEVGRRCRLRMIRLEPAEEAARGARARLEPDARILEHGHRMLVLAAPARQARGEARRQLAGARREA